MIIVVRVCVCACVCVLYEVQPGFALSVVNVRCFLIRTFCCEFALFSVPTVTDAHTHTPMCMYVCRCYVRQAKFVKKHL